MAFRKLRESEISLAHEVFGDSLPYERVHLVDYHLPRNYGVAVTTAQPTKEGGIASMRLKINYFIYWDIDVFDYGADSASYLNGRKVRDTFIHELTHVWQGHNGSNPFTYMAKSLGVQGWAWLHHRDRNRAYWYDPHNLRHWSSYNVEQQACLVEDWFSEDDRQRDDGVVIKGGQHSPEDSRFPYIINNIRPGKTSVNLY